MEFNGADEQREKQAREGARDSAGRRMKVIQ
jgi:hypothetical protein